jgi:outer membrane protein OmpA-like peptidoglycan-associated protein
LGTALLLAPLLIAAKCNPHKDKEVDVETVEDLPSPSSKLVVGGVDPAFGVADRAFAVEIFGSGFQSGATVSFSNTDGSGARVSDENAISVSVPALPAGVYDVIVKNPDGEKGILRRGLTLQAATDDAGCNDFTVHFGFDSSIVEPAMRAQLDTLAACVKGRGATVRVEGNCDNKGTTEYNLALGQRRAESITRYLQGLGVAPQKLRAVSYGEERPAASGNDDASQAKNRRADILVQQ